MTAKIKALSAMLPPREGDPPFATVPYYIAQQRGWYVNSPGLFGVSQTPTHDAPPIMQSLTPKWLPSGVKLPAFIVSQAHDFFLRIWNKQQTECSLYITYNDELKRFAAFVPEQYVSRGGVQHALDTSKLQPGFHTVGTIHSHCNFAGYHSGTDENDMKKLPGVHLTIGHVDKEVPEIAYAISAGNVKFDVPREIIIDEDQPLSHLGFKTAPEFWDQFVHQGIAPWGRGGMTSHNPKAVGNGVNGVRGSATDFDWDADDGSFRTPFGVGHGYRNQQYSKQYTNPEPTEMNAYQKKRIQDIAEQQDAFLENKDLVDLIEDEMQTARVHLALFGFAMNYNITYNKIVADKIVTEANVKDIDIGDQMEQLHLLPEERSN